MVLERSFEDRVAETMYKPKITKGVAERSVRGWFSKGVKAPDLAQNATIIENYLIFIPFWRFIAQGKAVACGYSEFKERTGNKIRNIYEELVDEEFVWTECACDTGKYGFKELWLEPGDEVSMEKGSVVAIEAGGSALEARERGKKAIRKMINETVSKRIETVTLDKSFLIPKVFELVYAPVWLIHYEYKDGHYTAAVDGVKGDVIGGTAPINMTARTRMMILSMSAGGIMIGSAVAMMILAGTHILLDIFPMILLLFGIALSMAAYPAFKEGKKFVSTGTMGYINNLHPAVRIPKQLTDHEILNRRSQNLTCPYCGEVVEQPWGEVVTPCTECGKLLEITSDEVKPVPYDVAKSDLLASIAMKGEKPEYIPFWRFDCDVEITDFLSGGDSATGLPDITGKRTYYICCGDVPRYIAEPWEIDLTIRNPEIVEDFNKFNSGFNKILINKKTAQELTEFLYLRYQTEKPGILQVLRYNFTAENARIVYIPYYKEEGKYIPGV